MWYEHEAVDNDMIPYSIHIPIDQSSLVFVAGASEGVVRWTNPREECGGVVAYWLLIGCGLSVWSANVCVSLTPVRKLQALKARKSGFLSLCDRLITPNNHATMPHDKLEESPHKVGDLFIQLRRGKHDSAVGLWL